MKTKVSVIIPTYRRAALLDKCLKGLSRQAFPRVDYEVIVVTDGPDTESLVVVERYRQQGHTNIHCIVPAEKKGPAAARNKGWQAANSDLIVFTDDDCLPDIFFVDAYYKAWKQTNRERLAAFTGKVIVPVPPVPTDYEQNVAHLATADFITANCACTRAALAYVEGFDENFPTAWREDSDLEFKLIQNNVTIYKVPDAIITHPVRAARWGISLKEQRKSLYNALLYKKHPILYRSKISDQPQWHYYGILACFVLTFVSALYGAYTTTLLALAGWAYLTGVFAYKRLSRTSRSLPHVTEMIYTSLLIPFLSIFWTLYGAIRYKVFFL